MLNWTAITVGMLGNILIAELLPDNSTGWVTTIGPWGVMYFILDRLTRSHKEALDKVAEGLSYVKDSVTEVKETVNLLGEKLK